MHISLQLSIQKSSQEFTSKWGSGYPGDAVTKKFLQENLNDLFGFPSIVRFSWKTAENILEEKGIKVQFEEVTQQNIHIRLVSQESQ